jgi:hypothetical protein
MFKELFKRWFGTTETKSNNKQRIKIQKFESVELGREYINRIKTNKTHKEIARYLNNKGYRTVRGCKFESHSVLYYMQDDIKLNKIREGHKSNYYWNKKKNSKGVTA